MEAGKNKGERECHHLIRVRVLGHRLNKLGEALTLMTIAMAQILEQAVQRPCLHL